MNSLVRYGIYAAIIAALVNTYIFLFGKMTLFAAMKLQSGDEMEAMSWISVMLVTVLATLAGFAAFGILSRMMGNPFLPYVALSSAVVLILWFYTANISTPDTKTKIIIGMLVFFNSLVLISVLGYRRNAEE